MPPKMQTRRPVRQGSDPTVSIANASVARAINANNLADVKQDSFDNKKEKSNDDLKSLIQTLKNKIGTGTGSTQPQKIVPPKPQKAWKRSVTGEGEEEREWTPKPAYSILTRVSDHETVPIKSKKQTEITINSLPHAFLYKPGSDGITVDKISVKAGKQLCLG